MSDPHFYEKLAFGLKCQAVGLIGIKEARVAQAKTPERVREIQDEAHALASELALKLAFLKNAAEREA